MSKDEFNKLKEIGHWLGMVIIFLGFLAFLNYKVEWYFFCGLLVYWLLNYGLIRGIIESKYIQQDK